MGIMFKRVALAAGSIGGMLVATPASGGPVREQLIVRIYNTFGVASHDMAAARAVAEAILKDAAIATVWRSCALSGLASEPAAAPCGGLVGPDELIVRVVGAGPTAGVETLGYSFVDLERKRGSLATVFADRVARLSPHLGVDSGTLLGRAMAHEIAHLLLGTADHSRRGLMRADWSASRAEPSIKRAWLLSDDEKARILERFAETRLQRVAVAPAERQARAADQQHDVLAVER